MKTLLIPFVEDPLSENESVQMLEEIVDLEFVDKSTLSNCLSLWRPQVALSQIHEKEVQEIDKTVEVVPTVGRRDS